MREDRLKRIARAASAGFAMPITAQIDEDWARKDFKRAEDRVRKEALDMDRSPSPFDEEWARKILDEIGIDNVGPTERQRSEISGLEELFPDAMDMSTPDPSEDELLERFPGVRDQSDDLPDFEDQDSDFDDEDFGEPFSDLGHEPWESLSSNSSRLIRMAAHLDSIGLHDVSDELDVMTAMETEGLLESLSVIARGGKGRGLMDGTGPRRGTDECPHRDIECPEPNDDPKGRGPGKGFGTGRGRGLMDGTGPRGETDECPHDDDLESEARKRLHLRGPRGTGKRRGPGTGPRSKDGTCPFVGKPKRNASVRMAQAQLAEVGLEEDDVDLDPTDDQSQIVSFDPDRGNMVVRTPDNIFKLYEITGTTPEGKPTFEFSEILDSPDDRVADYTHRLTKGNPSLEDYGKPKLPNYLDQLMGGDPGIQQAYASRSPRNQRFALDDFDDPFGDVSEDQFSGDEFSGADDLSPEEMEFIEMWGMSPEEAARTQQSEIAAEEGSGDWVSGFRHLGDEEGDSESQMGLESFEDAMDGAFGPKHREG